MKRLKPQARTIAAIAVIAVCILANVALYAFRPFGHAAETAPVSAEKGSAASNRSPEGESAPDAEEASGGAVRAAGREMTMWAVLLLLAALMLEWWVSRREN